MELQQVPCVCVQYRKKKRAVLFFPLAGVRGEETTNASQSGLGLGVKILGVVLCMIQSS
jgi:hypothetical protein